MNKEKKYKLPGFKCPNPDCKAKNVVFAADTNIYNNSKVILFENASKDMCADYIVVCPKCKSYLVICNQIMVNIPTIVEN